LRPFDADSPPNGSHLEQLHQELLPRSPVVALGERFLRDFYYSVLPAEGLVFGCVAYMDKEPVGFATATGDSEGFLRKAAIRRPLRLGWVLGTTLLRHPGRWKATLSARKFSAARGSSRPAQAGIVGEVLSLGVREPWTKARANPDARVPISLALFRTVLGQLWSRGVTHVRAAVDCDNLPAKLFYHAQGWELVGAASDPWPVEAVEFWLDLGR
jgi:hypothetical protein